MSLNQVSDITGFMELPTSTPSTLVQTCLNDANLFITETLANANPTLSTARLTTIERYIACHLLLMYSERGGLTSSQTGEYSRDTYIAAVFSNKQGFEATRYGQQAILYDTSGILKGLTKSQLPAQFATMGGKWGDPTQIVTSSTPTTVNVTVDEYTG